jgi:hypothetical protein
MARKIVDIGVEGNDGTGDSIREGFRKVNENFREIYAVFGQEGTLSFLDLGDVEGGILDSYSTKVDHLPIVNSQGSGITFKQLQGAGGLTVSYPEDPQDPNFGKIVLTQERAVAELGAPGVPGKFGALVDGRGFMFGNIGDPTVTNVLAWNSALGRTLQNVIPPEKFPVTLGFADNRYINRGTEPGEQADAMIGYLAVPAGATGDQVPQANEVVLKSGGTMTGNLFLNDHPGDLSGAGTPLGSDDLQAASKYYVDVTAYSSKVNVYVSTQGDDSQRKTPLGKEGRAWNYAYRTIVAACLRAEQLIDESPWEPGPYRQFIAYGNGRFLSEIVPGGVAIGGGLNGTTRISFTNDSGNPVDQGVVANRDIIPGKLVVGASSSARGFIVKYDTNANVDYVDLRDVTGTFQVGENLIFDQPVKRLEISIYVESGTYFEDMPIKLPQNCSLVGDEFRRTVIRPLDRPSQSPWAATWFYRDLTFDGLPVAETNWGYHYLTDPTNKGSEPKNNKDIDVFLCNDATIIRQISCQGHGGFMMVLDPEGQILTKSPYCQQSGCFSASLNKQAFRGGQYVDGQAGSMPVSRVNTSEDFTEITITDAFRVPQTPTSFFVEGDRYKIDTFTDNGLGYRQASELLLINKDFIVEETIAYVNDVVTPTFTYDSDKYSQNIGLIINAVAWDIAFDSNIQSINTALEYYIRNDDAAFESEKFAVIEAITFVKGRLGELLSSNAVALGRANDKMDTILRIIVNGIDDEEILTASSWSYATDPVTGVTTITVNRTLGHNLGAGWSVFIDGASSTSNSPNGSFNVVTAVNATTFTYQVINAPTGAAGGNLRFRSNPVSLRSIPNPPADSQAEEETINEINNSLARLVENRELVKAEYIAFINFTYPEFTFGSTGVTGYSKDIDRIVNAVIYDSIYGGNSQTILAAKAFFDSNETSLVRLESNIIWPSLGHARDIAVQVTTDIVIADLKQSAVGQVRGPAGTEEIADKVEGNFNLIINALRFGADTLPNVVYPSTSAVLTGLRSAKLILELNSNLVITNTIDYIDSRFLYDETAAQRDIRQLIDDLAHDIVYTGDLKMIEHGLSYFVGDAKFVSDAERSRTLQIIDYFKLLAVNVVNNEDVPSIQTISAGSFSIGTTYKIVEVGNTVWTALGAPNNNKNTVFTATATGLVTAGDFVPGRSYTIVSKGTTNFFTLGAISEVVGTSFIATSAGTGTGTATQGNGRAILSTASLFYRRQFKVPQNIQLASSGTGIATLLPSLQWVNTTLNNVFERLQEEKNTIQSAVINEINDNIDSANPGTLWFNFEYNSGDFARELGYIIDAVGYDMMFNSNVRSINAVRISLSSEFLTEENLDQTVASFGILKEYLQSTVVSLSSLANTRVGTLMDLIINITQNGESVIPAFLTPDPAGYSSDFSNARRLVKANRSFLIGEITSWIDFQKINNISPFATNYLYDIAAFETNVGYILDALEYDLTYGGNLETLIVANSYFDGAVSTIPAGQQEETDAAYERLKEVVGKVAQGVTVGDKKTVLPQDVSGTGGSEDGSVDFARERIEDVIKKINITSIDSTPTLESLVATTRKMVFETKGTGFKSASKLLNLNRDFIKAEVVNFINYTYSFDITASTTDSEFVTASTANMRVGMPIVFKGTDPFNATVISASPPVEVGGKFQVTFEFARRSPIPDATKQYEIIDNANANYNLVLSLAPTGAVTATSITLVYDSNPGIFGTSTTTTIRVAGGAFGGVSIDNKYYVREIISPTNFTISASISGSTPGAELSLNSDTGEMICMLAYNQATCARDTGFLVSNISTDILYGGRYNTIKAALRYWAASSFLVTAEQSPETRAGIEYINTLAQKIIINDEPVVNYQELNDVLDAFVVSQKFNTDLEDGLDAGITIAGLVTLINTIIQNGPSAKPTDSITYPQYVLQLNEETPYDPRPIIEGGSGALPSEFVIQGAGNTSMLSNDWTQLNDLGYGLVATNNGLIETVSVFTYYCWVGYYACNGGQIRSVAGSIAQGEYGLVAEGSDPFEVPDAVNLRDDMVQIAKIYKSGPFATQMGVGKTTVFIEAYGHLPYNISEVEINHGYTVTDGVITDIGFTRYELANITDASKTYFSTTTPEFSEKTEVSGKWRVKFTFPRKINIPDTEKRYVVFGNTNAALNNITTGLLAVASTETSITLEYDTDPGTSTGSFAIELKPGSIIRLNLNTAGNNDTAATGLQKDLEHGQLVTIRSNQNFRFYNVDETNPTRPSTALTFREDPVNDKFAPVYRVLSFNTSDPLSNALTATAAPLEDVILTFDKNYSYVTIQVEQQYNTLTEVEVGIDNGSPTRTLGSKVGDKYLAIRAIGSASDLKRIFTGEMAFAWNGRVHRIKGYILKQITPISGYGIIELSEFRSGTNGSLISEKYQDLVGNSVPTGITAPTRPGLGYNVPSASYNTNTGIITYDIAGVETAPDAPVFTGSISGPTLTVTAVASGKLIKNLAIQAISGSGITPGTLVLDQLTSTGDLQASTTAVGASGQPQLTVASISALALQQMVSGIGVPSGTVVISIDIDTLIITLSKNLTATASGTYQFRPSGLAGTYLVNTSQTVTPPIQIGSLFTVFGNNNQSYNISGIVLESTPATLTIAVTAADAVATVGADGTMTVFSITGNTLQLGQSISGTGIPAGTFIRSQVSGTAGSTGVYKLNANPNIVTPIFTASIDTDVLTVITITSGTILVGAEIQRTTGSGITADTVVNGQITSEVTLGQVITNATGDDDNPILNVNSSVGIIPGQLVTGTGIPENTYVDSTLGNVITLTQNLTSAAVGGSYTFRTAGGAGTYRINNSQTVTGSNVIAAVFRVVPGTFGAGATRIFPNATVYNPNLVQDNNIILRVGLSRGEPSDIIVNISTCRVTGHDFSDVGTGGYNQSNYPTKIYGAGRAANQQKEVAERGTGRVFWVATDQSGFFRVGRFFTVDQGTGTVSFAASIALSSLDGLGFKNGAFVTEFSFDAEFQDNADDAVPTEAAVQGYINRRLGIDRNDNPVGGELIGAGFLDRRGILEMNGNIKMNNFNVTGLGLTVDAPPNAAARKDYVDGQQLADNNVDADGKVNNDVLIYNGDRSKWVNAKSSTDNSQLQISLVTGVDKELDIRIKRETINDSQISKDAAITQDKVEINDSTVQRDSGTLISSITKSVGTVVSTAAEPGGKSPNITVRFFLPENPPKPRTGIYYTISGNGNVNYNGKFFCETSSVRVGGAAAWIELTYSENPGVFGVSDPSTTTITPWETTVNTQLAHGLLVGDNATITNSSVVEVTTSAIGAINTNLLTVPSGVGVEIGTGQLVTGIGIPSNTYVKYVASTTVVLTKKLTTTASGSYTFATTLNGNWTVLAAPTTTSFVISADTRVAGTYTTTAARVSKLGLSTFNRNQFNVTNGFVDLETSTTTTVTATIAAGNTTVTLQSAAAMANITVGSVITIASDAGTVTMPVVNVQNPAAVTTNGTQPITVTVTAITSATTFTVSTAFAGTGNSSTAVLNILTGVPLSSVQQIETDSILGNISGSRTAPTTVTTGQIVEAGDGIKNTEFKNDVLGNVETVHGIMSVMTIDTDKPHKNTYGVWNLTTNGASNSVVRTTADGSIEATSYILDGELVLDTSSGTTIDMYTPGGAKFFTAIGDSGTQPQPNINIGSLTTAIATTATAIATVNSIGTITVTSTANMYIGQEITFSGTTFGGIISGGTYYIISIPSSTTLTMSSSETLTPVVTGAGAGTMTVTSVGVLNGLVSLPRIRANNTVTFNPVNANISIQPRSTNGTSGTVVINPAVNGSINNMTIGTGIASPGRFTTVLVTDVTDATNATTAPFNVAGGAGIAKKLFVGGDLSVSGSTVITGNLTVNGITTTINSSDLTVDDKNVVLASVGTTGSISCEVNGSGVATNLRDSAGQPPTGLISGMVVTKVSGTAVLGTGTITISQINSQDSVNFAVTAGGFTAGTLVFTAAGNNNSTADQGGVILKALADKSILWLSATDRWTSNVGFEASEIENTPIGGDLPSSARFTSLQIDDGLTIGSNNDDNITINSKFVTGSQLKTGTVNNNTLSIAAYDVDGVAYANLVTLTASDAPKIDIVSTAVGTINNVSIGATTRSTGAFTTLAANDTTTLTGAVNINGENVTTTISPTGTTGTVTIAPIAEGSINNMSIGATTAKSAAFTSLAASGLVTLTNNTDAAAITRNAQGAINNWDTVTGAVKVTGGMLVQKDLQVGGTIYAGGFSGAFTGTADNAKQVQTQDKGNTNATYYLTFVDSNNATATDETVYTDGSLSFNASTNTVTFDTISATSTTTTDLTVTNTITGSVNGNAGTVTNGVYTNGSYSNPTWITALAGSKINSALTVDTSGNAGSASKFNGNRTITLTNGVTGSATWDGAGNVSISCTVGSTAASNVIVTNPGAVEDIHYLLFADGTSGTQGRQVRADGGLSYKPSDNTLTATTFAGKATSAQYADLAENYLADTDYDEGTVLIFGGDLEITASSVFNDRRVAGVVSTKPAHLMNSELKGDHVVAVALQGRVPVKVIGRVQKGDILVTSGKKGYAIVNNDPKVGTVIGKSLENKTTDGDGVVEAVVGKH